MRITLESTGFFTKVKQAHAAEDSAVECRMWQGETESGTPICCLIARIAVNSAHNQEEFERDLLEQSAPVIMPDAFPLRMVL